MFVLFKNRAANIGYSKYYHTGFKMPKFEDNTLIMGCL